MIKLEIVTLSMLVFLMGGVAIAQYDDLGVSEIDVNSDLGSLEEIPPIDPNIQEQPATDVSAEPISPSEAERLRQNRRSAEMETEDELARRLEQGRLEDEQRRRAELMGETATQAEPRPISLVRNYYVGGVIGLTEYPDVGYVDNDLSYGLALGAELNNKFTVDGSFIFSRYTIDHPQFNSRFIPYKDMEQYNFNVALKYSFFEGLVRPVAGGVASYTYRKYSNSVQGQRFYTSATGTLTSTEDSTTDAFDMGLLLGLDFDLIESFSVGIDYRYMFNLASQDDNINLDDYRDPVESLNYYSFGLTGRVRF